MSFRTKPLDLSKARAKLAAFQAENPKLFEPPVQCRECGRPLTDPASIQRGVGPECAERAGAN